MAGGDAWECSGFQSAPRLTTGRNFATVVAFAFTPVSIRSPSHDGEKRCGCEHCHEGVMFQSAPRLTTGRNLRRSCHYSLVTSFNPLPVSRRGETRRVFDYPHDVGVSIRSPSHDGEKRQQGETHEPRNTVSIRSPSHDGEKRNVSDICAIIQYVSIRSPSHDGEKHVTARRTTGRNAFQSAPRLTTGRNPGSPRRGQRRCRFNPLPVSRRGETSSCACGEGLTVVSIRSPSHDGEKPVVRRGETFCHAFQSAPRLTTGRNYRSHILRPCQRVSIRSPSHDGEKRQSKIVETNVSLFQSAPRLTTGRNAFSRARDRTGASVSIRSPSHDGEKLSPWNFNQATVLQHRIREPPPFRISSRPSPLTAAR